MFEEFGFFQPKELVDAFKNRVLPSTAKLPEIQIFDEPKFLSIVVKKINESKPYRLDEIDYMEYIKYVKI